MVVSVELVPAVAPLGSRLACTTALAACVVVSVEELAAGLAVAPLGCKLSCKAALAACVEANAASRDGCTAACVVAACGTSQGGCAAACMAALAACMAMSVDEPAAPPAEGQLYFMLRK